MVKEQFSQYIPNDIKLQLIKSKDIHKDLLEFDRNYYKGKYKFGILYAKPGQVNESEFFLIMKLQVINFINFYLY